MPVRVVRALALLATLCPRVGVAGDAATPRVSIGAAGDTATPQVSVAVAPTASDAASDTEVEVTVGGERPHPLAAPRARGVSGSVVDRSRLEQPGVSAADVLREAPGVQVSQLGGLGAPATASLRGATGAQTPVYLAGVRINDEVGGVANLADVPVFLLDRVEIYRSHTPLDASRLGIGGALFFTPRRVHESEMSLGTTFGSYGTVGARTHVAVRRDDRQVLAGFGFDASQNDYEFEDSRGTLFVEDDGGKRRLSNADASQQSFWLLASDRLGDARVSLLFHHAGREQGAPKLALVPTESARASFSRDLLVLRSELPIDAWDGGLELGTSATRAETELDDPQSELGLLTLRTRTPGERVEQVVEARQNDYGSLRWVERLTLSTERLRRFAQSSGQMREELSARRITMRPAVGVELDLSEQLSLSATGALECFDTGQGELDACAHLSPTGRGGVLFHQGSIELYANVGHYTRPPTLTELYGASLLVRGNEHLHEERGRTFEIGARHQVSRPGGPPLLWTEAAGFARVSTDLVTYVRTAQGYLHPVNRESSRTLGGELAVGSSPVRGAEVEAHLSLLDPRDTSANRVTKNDLLPFLSRATAFVRGRYERDVDLGRLRTVSLGARYAYQTSRYADPAGLGVIPAQGFVDLEMEAAAVNDELVARARISNLFDAERFDVVGFPLPGRSAFFSLEATW